MPRKSSRRRSRRRRSRSRRGGSAASWLKGKTGIAALVARYITQVLKPGTWYPKTRQLMLDSFVYASLVADKYKASAAFDATKPTKSPVYGKHTYLPGQPAVKGGKDDEAMEAAGNVQAAPEAAPAPAAPAKKKGRFGFGGKRRRRSRRRRKSRRKSRKSRRKRRKSRRKRKRSRRRRRR